MRFRYSTSAPAQDEADSLPRVPRMSQLAAEEAETMRSQSVTASKRNVRYLPYAFTEHAALMAASVLNTPRAIDVSVKEALVGAGK